MKKKILCFIIMMTMLWRNTINLYAAEAQDDIATAYLIDRNNGAVIEVPVEEISRSVEQEGNRWWCNNADTF